MDTSSEDLKVSRYSANQYKTLYFIIEIHALIKIDLNIFSPSL